MEIGWRKVNGDGNSHTVFYFWVENGVQHETVTNLHPSDDTNPDFKIQNSNANNYWSVDYEGSSLQSVHATFNFAPSFVTNAEKHDDQDSLYSHFHGLSVCTVTGTCTYHNPGGFRAGENTTGNWVWCKIDNTEHFVRQNNC